MKVPVSICIIVKNEPLLEDCLKSIRNHVAEIVVVDTGSTDETTQIVAKKYADIFEVYTACNDPITGLIEDFSMARQRSFDLATQPWCFWMDADDIIIGAENLPIIIQDFEKNKGDLDGVGFMFPYEYSYDQNGNCTCRHFRERLVFNKKFFSWTNPVHEVLVPADNAKIAMVPREELIFKHRRQYSSKVPEVGRNLRILRKYFEKVGETDARQMYYLGLECCNAGLVDEAIQHLSRYIELSGWHDERAMACLKLVEIYQLRGDYQNGLKWAFKTVEIFENWSEGYFSLGKMFYFLGLQGGPDERRNWEKCVYFINQGLKFPPTKTLLFINPLEREAEIYEYLNMALNKIGDVKGALEACNTALEKHPNQINLVRNKKLYEVFLARNDAVVATNKLRDAEEISQKSVEMISALLNKQPIQVPVQVTLKGWHIPNTCDLDSLPLKITTEQLESAVIMMWKQFMLFDEATQAMNFLQNSPSEVKNSTIIQNAINLTADYLINKKILPTSSISNNKSLDIVFFAGDGVEFWNPDIVKQNGIGGSELMMMALSKRLAALGHKVRVYNSCGSEGKYDGVEYHHTHTYQNLICDVLIVSRLANMLADQFNIQAKLKLLWVHDVFALNATNELLLKADRILALSQWHKQNLIRQHNIHADHIITTANGIDLLRFNKKIQRNRFKCINSSSPDRSWPILLECWPEIKKQVPEAELHLFYGFKNWEAMAKSMPGHSELIAFLKNKIDEMKPLGVVYHDRVNQEKLSEEFLSAGAWIHPTWFTETSCITAMEAQAAGLRIVTSNIAALKETVADRGTLLDGDWTSEEYKKSFIENVVKCLINTNDSDRIKLQNYAGEHFCLDKLAKNWEKMFFDLIEEIKVNPIVPYQPTIPYQLNGRGYYDGDTRLAESHPERRKQNG